MPLGPVHVALEEPVYFNLTVEGETIRKVELTSGHVHRGMEALATQRNLIKNVTLTERVCSLCSNSHSFTYSMAVENVLGMEIPRPRPLSARAGRRDQARGLASVQHRHPGPHHRLQVPVHARHGSARDDAGREGDRVRQPHEPGLQLHRRRQCDVPPDMLKYILDTIDKVEPAVDEIREIYATNSMVLGRTRGLGLLPREDALRLGVVGPVARGSGIATDVRKDSPYAAYPDLGSKSITHDGCCIHSRTMVRLDDLRILQAHPPVLRTHARRPPLRAHAPIHTAEACARSEAPAARSSTTSVPTARTSRPVSSGACPRT